MTRETEEYDFHGGIEKEFEAGPVSDFDGFMRDVRRYVVTHANDIGRPCRITIDVGIDSLRDSEE